MIDNRLSADYVARRLSSSRATVYAKLQGVRRWQVADLRALSSIGVKLPPLDLPDRSIGAAR